MNAQLMRRFRVKLEEGAAENIFVKPTHSFKGAERAEKMQVPGVATTFRPTGWNKKTPRCFFLLVFSGPVCTLRLEFPIQPPAEA
ncbi:MAG: hypothetical protein ABSE59_00285, partial [Opitutaceae bacterium]